MGRVVGIGQAKHADFIAEQLADPLDGCLKHLVDGQAVDDPPLELCEPLKQDLPLSQRPEQASILARLALGARAQGALVVKQPQVAQSKRQHPAHTSQQAELVALERLPRPASHHQVQGSLVLERHHHRLALPHAWHRERLRASVGHRHQRLGRKLPLREPDRRDHSPAPNECHSLGVQHLRDALDPSRRRRPFIVAAGDQRQELSQLLGRPAGGGR